MSSTHACVEEQWRKQLGRSLHKREEMSAEKQSEGRGGFLAAVVVYLCFSGLFFRFLFLNAGGKQREDDNKASGRDSQQNEVLELGWTGIDRGRHRMCELGRWKGGQNLDLFQKRLWMSSQGMCLKLIISEKEQF